MSNWFQIEKSYWSADDINGPMLTDHVPILFESIDKARAYYEASTDPWFADGESPAFAIAELTRQGLEVGYHPLPARESSK